MAAFDELHVCGGATPLPFIWAFENATISMCFKTQEGYFYVEKLDANGTMCMFYVRQKQLV